MENKEIWTIGHSTRPFKEFVDMLHSFHIRLVVDVRSYPGSRRYPHFNKEVLVKSLPENKIEYQHLVGLGGRRKVLADSKNTGWRHPAFRGYADYMETRDFEHAAIELESLALNKRTAYMCSEAVWWRCHRSMVSDWLKMRGWTVWHIMGINKAEEHPWKGPARVIDGRLDYSQE
ncbi:MAG: DUF488 domain-containing protein [Lentimicrobiaceae bacterium]|nr:DUF488 domain-containing protein [Lentimicrobiaceae bacterium]